MVEVHDIFRVALSKTISHGDQTVIAKKTGLTVSKVNKLATGENKGSEDNRRAIAAALGYQYEAFLDLGRRALGLPVARREAPPSPEVGDLMDKACKVAEMGGDKAAALKTMIESLLKE